MTCARGRRGARRPRSRDPTNGSTGWSEPDEAEALREAARRFLHAYGPARSTDFLEWFGAGRLNAAHGRALFEALELDEVDVEGHRAHVLAGDTDFPESSESVRLLPEYDSYVMGFRERDQLIPSGVRAQVAAHGRGRYEGPAGVRFLLVDGVAAGTWARAKRGKRFEVQVTPIERLGERQRDGLEAEVARIGAFLGLEPVLTVG